MFESVTVAKCPLIRKACIKHDCAWYTHVQGKHPQSEATIDCWDCSMNWLPQLLVENAQMTRHTTASVDKLHNGFQAAATSSLLIRAGEVLAAGDNAKLIEGA